MTEVLPKSRVLPAVVKAFATAHVMRGLRPAARGSRARHSAEAIGKLMRTVAEREGHRTEL